MKKTVSEMVARACKSLFDLRLISPLLKRKVLSTTIVRTVSVILITALLTPIFLFNPIWQTQAQSRSTLPVQSPAPISAPPEPFVIGSVQSTISSSIVSSLSSVKEYFSTPQLPEGFEVAKVPTLSERIVSTLGTVFGSLFGISGSATNNSGGSVNNGSTSNTVSTNILFGQLSGGVDFDFDDDGKADIARWHASNTEWKIKNSSNGNYQTVTIGSASSVIAPGDFDGDGATDPAVFNAGTWTIKKSSDNQTVTASFGTSGDKPVVGDYDGDGKSDLAVFRPSTNTWWIYKSTDSSTISISFGSAGDIPVQGKFDGDPSTDIALFRPSTGDWHIQGSTDGYYSVHWGNSSDIPVPADYTDDGKTDLAVFRGATGTWYVLKSEDYSSYLTQAWGNYGDQPVPADYDGDGKADYAVWRPTTGVWYTIKSNGNVYDTQTLGVSGDTAVSSAYLKQIGGLVYSYDFAKVRLSPKNSTGGTDLYSRNFAWGTGLVGLPGRAGLDAGFGISYNSLVWTKDAATSTMIFDADNSNVTPGFRMGFPTIEPVYYDAQTGKFAYLMVTPSGSRVEFRQTAASNVYETADSSYTQLKINSTITPNDPGNPNEPAENLTITVTNTSGTNMLYEWKNGAYRCQKITDRNGNYITISHDTDGKLQTVTDTLGRVITVNYTTDGYPDTITQTWKDTNGAGSNVTHTWAAFSYTTQAINTNFSGSQTVVGPGDGYSLKVLQKIKFPSETNGAGPNTVFTYNTWGQVTQVTNYAADNHELNHTAVNLPTNATNSEPDCPRFTETRTNAENFNGGSDVVVHNSIPESATYDLPDNITGSASLIKVWVENHPNNLITKTYVGSSGWKEGLPIATEDCVTTTCSGNDRKRWTWSDWTQDDENLSYILNPRVEESKIGDGANTKRTKIYYLMRTGSSNVSQFGLVNKVEVYDQSNVLKTQTTTYSSDSNYLSRRIIGLPTESYLYEGTESSGTLMSKATYAYDENGYTGTGQSVSATYHDNSNFGTGFNYRGNLTSTTRWDATSPSNSSLASKSKVKYNITGSPISQTDPLNRITSFSYTDSWNDNSSHNATFAYPTTITDPGSNTSTVKYRYDIGANVWAKSPAPTGNTTGKETTRFYDTVGRIEKVTLVNTGAYTRYEYPTNNIQSKVYSTIVDTGTAGVDSNDEVLSETWTDGAGQVRRSRTEHPNSTGGWTGVLVEYDILGQIKRSTVPTEISVSNPSNPDSWTPAGDDYRVDVNNNPTFLWKYQKYDWKGRVVRIIDTDGVDSSTLNDSDQLFEYEGCGCAGGQVVTIKGPSVPRDDQPNTNARRVQKIYQDILGRTYKKEEMEWNGTTPYKTTVVTFNGRDQVTQTREYAGSDSSSTFQDSTAIYDGFGRAWKNHVPEQRDSNNDPAYTTTTYNLDDSIQSITDARGATKTYTYNNLGLPSQADYSVPQNSNIPATPTTYFSYDAVGNRTQMIDASGTTTYQYNQLAQITSETKQFTGLSSSFTLGYEYELNGEVKKLNTPVSNTSVSYNYDKIGRVRSVTGQGFYDTRSSTTVTNIAANINYRAWNVVKSMDYGNSTSISTEYDNKLRVSSFTAVRNSTNFMEIDYQHNADGRVKFADDILDNTFDKSYQYDHQARLVKAKSGAEASGGTQMTGPYNETLGFDTFSNLTNRVIKHWTPEREFSVQSTFSNNQNINIPYDAEGNVTSRNEIDAAGNKTKFTYDPQIEGGDSCIQVYEKDYSTYDGEGQLAIKQHEFRRYCVYVGGQTVQAGSSDGYVYSMKSSVLGGFVVFQHDYGIYNSVASSSNSSTIFLHGKALAQASNSSSESSFYWKHTDPQATKYLSTTFYANGWWQGERTELDPMGADVGVAAPEPDPTPVFPVVRGEYGSPEAVEKVIVDGVEMYSNDFPGLMAIASRCPNNQCSRVTDRGFEYWTAYADGYEGYLPIRANYRGNGEYMAGEGVYNLRRSNNLSLPPPPDEPSNACLSALAAIDKDVNGYNRALENWAALEAVSRKYGIHASILAAIGIRESNFTPTAKENGLTKGVGAFQIDMRYHSTKISAQDALNVEKSAMYMGQILRGWYDDHVEALQGTGYTFNSANSLIAIAAAIHSYNSGKAYSRDYDKNDKSKFVYTLTDRFKNALDQQNVGPLDENTTGGNYVSTVWNIAIDCFGFSKK
jgi:YD repeat-containing protein